jgi:hypothetical protein
MPPAIDGKKLENYLGGSLIAATTMMALPSVAVPAVSIGMAARSACRWSALIEAKLSAATAVLFEQMMGLSSLVLSIHDPAPCRHPAEDGLSLCETHRLSARCIDGFAALYPSRGHAATQRQLLPLTRKITGLSEVSPKSATNGGAAYRIGTPHHSDAASSTPYRPSFLDRGREDVAEPVERKAIDFGGFYWRSDG